MATAPIITIAWQQPSKWIGVEEHVRRGRIRNRGELTTGMTVQVMYKKGWYKAKVINPDPLRTRNRTKKSCTCCTSPVKHSHHKRRDRKRGSRGHTSTSESDATLDGICKEDPSFTDTDSKTENDATLSTDTDLKVDSGDATVSNVEDSYHEVTDPRSKTDVNGENYVEDQRNIFDDMQGNDNVEGTGSGETGAELVGQPPPIQCNEKPDESENVIQGACTESNDGKMEQSDFDQQGDVAEESKDTYNNNNSVSEEPHVESNDEPNRDNYEQSTQKEVTETINVQEQVMGEEKKTDNVSQQSKEEEIPKKTYLNVEGDSLKVQDPIEQVLVEQVSVAQTPGEQVLVEPNGDLPSNELAMQNVTVAASQQIANEHMYSQRISFEVKKGGEQLEMSSGENENNLESATKNSEIATENIEMATDNSEIATEKMEIATENMERKDEQMEQDDVEPSLEATDATSLSETNPAPNDKVDNVSVDSEAASANDTSAVNVVYLRPSDIHMSTEDDDSQTNSTEQNEQESNEDDNEQPGDMNGHPCESEQLQSPVELEMARPDEPLGQIKISEPVSLAGTVNDQQEHPLELTTPKQIPSEENSNKPESEPRLSMNNVPGSKPAASEKPAEIKHKSKGLIARQTTLPSGRPGPIILTMKAKKPKHKKSKKKNKHKDKDKERSKDMVASPPGLVHTRPAQQPVQPQKPSEPPQRIGTHIVAAPNVPQKQLPPVSRQSTNMAARHPPAVRGQIQSPPIRGPPQSVAMMRSPNVVVSADGSMRHPEPGLIVAADGSVRQLAEPIRHIEPPRAHMAPRQQQQQPPRGPAPGSRSHSQSSQPSPTSPPNAHHHPQWYPVNMQTHQHHHPRMAGPGPPHGHPGHPHMSPGDFANMRARHPQPYHSGLPPYVEASFAGAPQYIRGASPNQHPLSNAPSPAEAAFIRAQSLARHCHHPHWQPNGPPHFVRDPHMHGPSVLRVPRYGHPPYPRMPGDMPAGAGRPPPLIPAPGPPSTRSVHPVSIHKIRPDGHQHPSRPADIASAASPNSVTPRSSTSESVQSLSPQNVAQKRPREPAPGEIENILAQQFQEGNDGERVIGVAELIELRNALRRHHGFTEEPAAKSPRLETVVNVNQPGSPQCPPMLASVGLQPRPPSRPTIEQGLQQFPGQAVVNPALISSNAASPRMQHQAVSIAHVPHTASGHNLAQVAPQPNQIESLNRKNAQDSVNAVGPQNVARHWVAEAQQLYPNTSANQTSCTNSNDSSVQPPVTVPVTTESHAVPAVPPLAPVQKPSQITGRSVQRSGRKQKTPHRRPTAEDTVVIKSEPIDPGYEAEENCMDVISNAETGENREQGSDVIIQPGSDSLDSVASEETPAEMRLSGSGPISQLQTLCTRLSSSRTSIIPSQSLQHVPPAHLTEQNQSVRSPSIPSGHSSPANPQVRQIPPLLQDTSSQVLESHRQSDACNPADEPASAQVSAAVAQPISPVELEPTSSGLNESAPSPDTSTATKVDRDSEVSRRLSFLEREMGIVKSWLWEIRTILTSRPGGGVRKGLPKCTDIGDGNVLIGSGEHSITIARSDYFDCWDKTDNAKDLVVKLISKVFTEEELAMSSYNGGMIRTMYKRRLADDQRFNAILAQAEKEYGAGNLEDRKAIREAVNNKCRKKAFKFRQQEAITQRISQQYQMYKE